MGCVSSKLFKEEIKREILLGNGDYTYHVVSLTSSTYGALKLDKDQPHHSISECLVEQRKSVSRQEPKIINVWELIEDLEDEVPISISVKKKPKVRSFLRGFADLDAKSPLKFLNQMGSPKKFKKFEGKENKGQAGGFGTGIALWDYSPKMVLKACNFQENSRKNSPNLRTPLKCDIPGMDLGVISSSWKSLGPLFDGDKASENSNCVCQREIDWWR